MRRPIHVRDVVEDGSEDVVVSHAIVKDVHETRHIAGIGDIESRLIHVTLHCNRRLLEDSCHCAGARNPARPGAPIADCARARTSCLRARMIGKSRLRAMRDEGDDDSSISAAGDHETGTAGSLPETWTHYPSVQAARAGAKVMYHNDRVLR